MKHLVLVLLVFSSLAFANKGIDEQIKKEFAGEFASFNAGTISKQKEEAKKRYEKIAAFEKKLMEDRIKMLDAVTEQLKKLKFGEVKANREVRKEVAKLRANFQKEVKLRRNEFRKENKKESEEFKKVQVARHKEFKKKVQVRRQELEAKK